MADKALALSQVALPSVHLVARNPNEMNLSRQCLHDWLVHKVAECGTELREVEEIRDHAKQSKWRFSGLERQVSLARRRLTFYEKVQKAIELGFTIVPNFPADIFAIRVTRSNPSAHQADATYRDPSVADEKPSYAKAGEGQYKAPEAKLKHWTDTEKDSKDKEITRYYSCPVEFQEIEFPIACARPEVMTAVTEAMSHKLFDSFALAPEGVIRKHKYDPIILGQIQLPKAGGYVEPKTVSFLIAWHLDLRTL